MATTTPETARNLAEAVARAADNGYLVERTAGGVGSGTELTLRIEIAKLAQLELINKHLERIADAIRDRGVAWRATSPRR